MNIGLHLKKNTIYTNCSVVDKVIQIEKTDTEGVKLPEFVLVQSPDFFYYESP